MGDDPPDAERERAEVIALLRSETDASLWWIRQSSLSGSVLEYDVLQGDH
jgi:hypothetical protein